MKQPPYMKDRTCLPVLPEGFWKDCISVSSGWDKMNLILDHEWEALKERDMKGLLRLARGKNILAVQLTEAEEKIFKTVSMLLEACNIKETADKWSSLRMILDPGDLRRFNEWKWQYDASRNRAVAVNKRLHKWITEQIRSNSELVAILTGRKEKERPTYSPVKQGKNPGMQGVYRFRHNSTVRDPMHAGAMLRSGISVYRGLQETGKKRSNP